MRKELDLKTLYVLFAAAILLTGLFSYAVWSNSKSGYHVREADATQNFNLVMGSNLYDDAETANISLQGTNSTEVNTIGPP